MGYVAQDPTARYIRGQAGTDPNLGRNTFISPGINVWNLSFFKNTALPWREGTTLQFRVEMWNAFNHSNPSVGNGSAFNTLFTGNNATSLPGYITPGSSQFLDETIFSGGLGNSPFQRVIQWGLRLLF